MFITNNKTFDEKALADQQRYHGHDYMMRTADKTFITEVLFIDWLQTQFIAKTTNFARTQTMIAQLS
jgi:hypothetical protein